MAAIVGALRAILSLESAAFTKGLSDAQLRLKDFDKKMKGIGGGMQKLGLAVSAAGAGIAASLRSALNQADDMGKAAQKFGVPVEALSQLAYAADLSDVSLETLGQGLKRLSIDMASGGAALANVGIAVRDATGQMRPTQEVLADVADLLAKMPDGADKTALAVRLLGKSGAEMIPLLNGGGQALRDMAAEADALGLTISENTVEAAERFNDNLRRLWGTLQGLSIEIAATLAPTLKSLSDKAVEFSKWFRDLSPVTKEWMANLALVTVAAGPALIALGALVKSLGMIRAVLAGITAMMAANPIVLGAMAIAGAAYLIYANWGPIKQFFIDIWDGVKAAADATYQAIEDATLATRDWVLAKWDGLKAEFALRLDQVRVAFIELWEKIKATTAQWVTDFLNVGMQIVEGLKAGIEAGWDQLVTWFTAKATAMIDSILEVFGIHSPSRVFHDIGENVTAGLANGLSAGVPDVANAMGAVTEAVSGASGSLKSALEDVKDWGRDTFAGLLKGTTTLGQALGGLRDKLIDTFANNAWDNLWGALFGGSGGVGEGGGLLSGVFNANGNVFRSGRVAAYAKGGVVTGPTTFPMRGGMGLMGEAGPEAILPLSRGPDGKLGVMARGGGGSQVIVQQTINISAGVAQTVRAEMLGLLPRFKEQALAGVIEANSRGGAARRGLA